MLRIPFALEGGWPSVSRDPGQTLVLVVIRRGGGGGKRKQTGVAWIHFQRLLVRSSPRAARKVPGSSVLERVAQVSPDAAEGQPEGSELSVDGRRCGCRPRGIATLLYGEASRTYPAHSGPVGRPKVPTLGGTPLRARVLPLPSVGWHRAGQSSGVARNPCGRLPITRRVKSKGADLDARTARHRLGCPKAASLSKCTYCIKKQWTRSDTPPPFVPPTPSHPLRFLAAPLPPPLRCPMWRGGATPRDPGRPTPVVRSRRRPGGEDPHAATPPCVSIPDPNPHQPHRKNRPQRPHRPPARRPTPSPESRRGAQSCGPQIMKTKVEWIPRMIAITMTMKPMPLEGAEERSGAEGCRAAGGGGGRLRGAEIGGPTRSRLDSNGVRKGQGAQSRARVRIALAKEATCKDKEADASTE